MVILDSRITARQAHAVASHPDIRVLFDGQDIPTLQLLEWVMRSPDMAVMVVRNESGDAIGIIAIRWLTPTCVKLSGGFMRGHRGKVVKEALGQLFTTLFKSMGVLKIVGEILPENRPCLMMGGFLGFKREGINRQSTVVKGELRDQIYMGLTIGEWYGRTVRK